MLAIQECVFISFPSALCKKILVYNAVIGKCINTSVLGSVVGYIHLKVVLIWSNI